MASISREANGRRTVQFVAADRRRKSIRLGKVPQRVAEAVKVGVERLVAAASFGHTVDDETARWLYELDDAMHAKVAAVGLAPARESAALGAFIDAYIDARNDAKPATLTTFRRAKKKLLGYFPADARLRDVTPGDADAFARWLRAPKDGGLSEATARKTVSIAKQFFRAAVRKKLIVENPFADLSGTVPANRKRDYFVSREEAAKVLDACPDAEWRLLFALSRYGGLRCPSETLRLRWTEIDWAENRMTVGSPKTEHHEGGSSRVVPIFPELRPYLLDAFEHAADGDEYVISRYRSGTQNLRTQLTRIIRRAGLEPWPKLWQNLRATCETELVEMFPAHVVSAWIGNSQAIAAKHYLQVTDEHFARASRLVEAVQNPVQHSAADDCVTLHDAQPENDKVASRNELQPDATSCESSRNGKLGVTGLEPVTSSV